jgi:hypothetical protein
VAVEVVQNPAVRAGGRWAAQGAASRQGEEVV